MLGGLRLRAHAPPSARSGESDDAGDGGDDGEVAGDVGNDDDDDDENGDEDDDAAGSRKRKRASPKSTKAAAAASAESAGSIPVCAASVRGVGLSIPTAAERRRPFVLEDGALAWLVRGEAGMNSRRANTFPLRARVCG
jgi:hypothetical protein